MPTPRLLLSVDDLDNDAVERVLRRANDWRTGDARPTDAPHIVGLLFLEPSLRTRAGFAAATARLGWQSIEVGAPRVSPDLTSESWEDTLRTFSGFVDVVVTRPGRVLERDAICGLVAKPLVNGGDAGNAAEHPTQALIDLFAFRSIAPVDELSIAICGDLRMRSVRSLVRLLARIPPRELVFISAPPLLDPTPLPKTLANIVRYRTLSDLGGVDVLYVAGMPHRCLPEDERATLRVTTECLARLPDHGVVLSPLPLLDEIEAEARSDQRIRMFDQSDAGVAVRMAILEEVLCHP
jgi:aspartate carbamoyltransferase catalytic subunit